MDAICVHMKEPAVTVLGPGTRYVLWVQGCHRNCPGCIAAKSHDPAAGKEIPVNALAVEIALSGADGLTISGGEPFLQAEALAELVRQIRQKRPMGVIVYTGYLYEELLAMPEAKPFLDEIDLLIDGPYVQALDDGKSLRGSSNQRVIPLTEQYLDALPLYGAEHRQNEQFQHGIMIHQIGIPDHSRPVAADVIRFPSES
jgi:anaerobic ribonucleoside-triphosphate reductase activating protein